ncbi:MAG: 1,4-alpha-glucan branching enzyme, partial [Chloroflexota bacterium]
MSDTSLLPQDTNALFEGSHRDPFGVLGPHTVDDRVYIRSLNPHSSAAFVIFQGDSTEHAMVKIDERGLYEISLPNTASPPRYRIKYVELDGHTYSIEDPYRFDSALPKELNAPLYEYMGAHFVTVDGVTGTRFAVWAPNAERVSVVGNFNRWDGRVHPMRFDHESGIWDIFVPEIGQGILYKYEIKTYYKGYVVNKTDPIGFFTEMRPKNASITWNIDSYEWHDDEWIKSRPQTQSSKAPISIYEVHLGSWRRKGSDGSEWLTYRESA